MNFGFCFIALERELYDLAEKEAMHALHTKATHDALNQRIGGPVGGVLPLFYNTKTGRQCLRKSPPADHYKTAAAGETASQTASQIHQG